MVEFTIRLALAGGLALVGFALGKPPFDVAWPIAAFIASCSVVGYLFDKRGLRNPGTSGFLAVADAGVIAYLASTLGYLDAFGFLVLLPIAYAVARYGSNPAAMAPIASAWLLVGSNLHGGMNPLILAQTLAVLSIGLLLNQGRIVMTVSREAPIVPQVPIHGPDPTQYMELRESFRRLKDYCRELERKGRRDLWAARLLEGPEASGQRLAHELCTTLKEMSGADGVSLYVVNHLAGRFAAFAEEGTLPEGLQGATFEFRKDLSEAQLKHRIDRALKAVKSEPEKQRSATVVLKHKGLMLGVVALHTESYGIIDEATRVAEEAAPVLAAILFQDDRQRQIQRKLAETELLYHLAATAIGAETTTSLCARVVRELWGRVSLDHLGLFILDGKSAIQAASAGATMRFLETMTWDGVQGVEGWIGAECPPLIIHDATQDELCDRLESVKRRVGSFALLPIVADDEVVGYLTASTHQAGSLGAPDMDTLRLVATELGQAISRLNLRERTANGLMTPIEFNEALKTKTGGCLVYLEPLHREELARSLGPGDLSQAMRTLSLRVRAMLPSNGMLCRRQEEDFVAFLPGKDEEDARRWANEAAALASFVPIKTEGARRVPLAVRARVAILSQQNDLISEAKTA